MFINILKYVFILIILKIFSICFYMVSIECIHNNHDRRQINSIYDFSNTTTNKETKSVPPLKPLRLCEIYIVENILGAANTEL